MKFLSVFSIFILSCSLISYASNASAVKSSESQAYSLFLATLENGVVHIELHNLPLGPLRTLRDCYAGEPIFSLDLGDHEGVYNAMSCDQSTEGNIVIRSHNEAMYDYCLNWGPMLGIDMHASQGVVFLDVAIEKQEQNCCYLAISGPVDNNDVNFRMYVDKEITAAIACAVPCGYETLLKINTECMSLTDACRLGVIATISRHQPVDSNCDLECELEFDRIIDSMMQDGTIKIKQDTPFMIQLKSVGSSLFMQYLAIKSYMRIVWNRIMGNNVETVQEALDGNQ